MGSVSSTATMLLCGNADRDVVSVEWQRRLRDGSIDHRVWTHDTELRMLVLYEREIRALELHKRDGLCVLLVSLRGPVHETYEVVYQVHVTERVLRQRFGRIQGEEEDE